MEKTDRKQFREIFSEHNENIGVEPFSAEDLN